MARISLPIRRYSSDTGWTAIIALRMPRDVMGSNPTSPRRPCTVVRQPFRLSGPYGKFSATLVATLLGQEENRERSWGEQFLLPDHNRRYYGRKGAESWNG